MGGKAGLSVQLSMQYFSRNCYFLFKSIHFDHVFSFDLISLFGKFFLLSDIYNIFSFIFYHYLQLFNISGIYGKNQNGELVLWSDFFLNLWAAKVRNDSDHPQREAALTTHNVKLL